MTQTVPVSTDTNHPDQTTYEASWIDAIVEDDPHLALQLLNGHTDTISDVVLSYENLDSNNKVGHTRRKHEIAWTSYAPDNVWSSTAVFNARKVMKILAEKQGKTGKTTHYNNFYIVSLRLPLWKRRGWNMKSCHQQNIYDHYWQTTSTRKYS